MRAFVRSLVPAPVAMVAAAYAVIALASSAAVWMFSRTFDELARSGGGIGVLSFGIWQAARLPLAAAWLAAVIGVVALGLALFNRQNDAKPAEPARAAASPWLAFAVAAGVAAVMLFRGATSFVLDAILPGRQPGAIATSLVIAGAGCVACFLVAAAFAFVSWRRGATPSRVALIVLVASLGVSAALVVNLRAFSNHWRGVAIEGQPIESKKAQ